MSQRRPQRWKRVVKVVLTILTPPEAKRIDFEFAFASEIEQDSWIDFVSSGHQNVMKERYSPFLYLSLVETAQSDILFSPLTTS